MKILVLGGSGLVGSRFIEMAEGYDIAAPTHDELDLLDLKQLDDYLLTSDAEVVINFAAFTNVDTAEAEKGSEEGNVYKLNVALPAAIANHCAANGKRFIHISTDYVFDGTKPTPYFEEDQPNPVNWYGKTKMLGEEAVKVSEGKWLIVRPEMPYSSHFEKKLDIARTFVKMLTEGKTINGVSDQKITPIYVDHLVYGLQKLIEADAAGIYHLASTDYTTPYDLAVMIAEKFNLDKTLVKPVPISEYNETRSAIRPINTYLDVSKFEAEYGKGILKTVSESLDEFKSKLKS